MTTLEKAARAAWDACGNADMSGYTGDDNPRWVTIDGVVNFYDVARAVLMAVREPDEDIWVAIGTASHDAYDTFPMVIDAILAQSEDPS